MIPHSLFLHSNWQLARVVWKKKKQCFMLLTLIVIYIHFKPHCCQHFSHFMHSRRSYIWWVSVTKQSSYATGKQGIVWENDMCSKSHGKLRFFSKTWKRQGFFLLCCHVSRFSWVLRCVRKNIPIFKIFK